MTAPPDLDALFGSADVTSFLGLPTCEGTENFSGDIAIIGAPCATPYRSVGAYCAEGPDAIRAGVRAFAANLSHHDFETGGPLLPPAINAIDCGNLTGDPATPAENRDRIRGAVSQVLDASAVPIILGGDDSIPIPVFEAFATHGPVTILQIDAHVDWRDSHEDERLGLSSTMRRASEMPHVERIIQVGQRGLGSARPSDVADAIGWGVTFISAEQVARTGIDAAITAIPEGANVIISFDCDALDPSIMPAVIGRAPGGLHYWGLVALLRGVAARGRIAAFNIVEFMPARDIDGLGALVAGRSVATALGLMARQQASSRNA
ncbi:MAG: arginase family protein [Pseudomonadota bacterium]